MSSFPIIIKDTDGNSTTLMVTNNMQIKEVKELFIQTNLDCSINENEFRTMEFFFKGKTLKDNQTLAECRIKAKNTICLLNMADNIEAAKFK